MESALEQVAVVLVATVVIALVATLLRQPLIVGLLAAGIIVGPEVLGLVGETVTVALLAEMGISLLLFVVGSKLDVSLVRSLGWVALATGLGQVVFTSASTATAGGWSWPPMTRTSNAGSSTPELMPPSVRCTLRPVRSWNCSTATSNPSPPTTAPNLAGPSPEQRSSARCCSRSA